VAELVGDDLDRGACVRKWRHGSVSERVRRPLGFEAGCRDDLIELLAVLRGVGRCADRGREHEAILVRPHLARRKALAVLDALADPQRVNTSAGASSERTDCIVFGTPISAF